jgi:excisionase family DNA binding protein
LSIRSTRSEGRSRQSDDDDELLTPQQVAEEWHTSVRHVRELWATRRLGGVRIGKFVRHRRSDLRKFLAAQAVDPMR